MSETAHTPGPWKAVPYPHTGQFNISALGGELIVYSHLGAVGNGPAAEANACLIAAAPELLEALRALLADIDADDGRDSCWCLSDAPGSPSPGPCEACLARAAIAKATK